MSPNWLGAYLFTKAKLALSSLFLLTRLSHVLHKISPLHSSQRLSFTGLIIPLLKDFYHDLGNITVCFSPSEILKH